MCVKSKAGLIGIALWACAALSHGGNRTDFRVNSDNSRVEQNHPRVAVAGDGSFVIVWVDKRNSSADIYLQRFDASGQPIGGNRMVNDDGLDAYQSGVALGVDLAGLYSMVWQDYRLGAYPFDPNVFFQRYDTSLARVASNLNLTIEEPDSLKETPDIALSPWGAGVVVWADYRHYNWDIYGQRIASDGSTLGANFKINSDSGMAQQHAPRVAVSPSGWFEVVWYDNRLGNDDIYAQRFDSLANPIAGNIKINSDAGTSRQAYPDVATDGAGHFTVVWVDWRNGTYPQNPDIFARKFSTLLVPVHPDQLVNTDGSMRPQREPCIAADRRGNVAIIWSDSVGGSYDIMGQMIDVEGVVREVNFQANSDADSAQLHPDVALDGRYRYITWADKRNGNYDIYASISNYNDPTLVPTPKTLHFEMMAGGTMPPSLQIQIDHFGYNPINFQANASHDWLRVEPASGITPASLSVSLTTGTLPLGSYLGSIGLYDLDNGDSSVVVSVRLDVTSPILELSSDTLVFAAFSGVPDSVGQQLMISNTGSGLLPWTASDEVDWLWPSATTGSDAATIYVWATAAILPAGQYLDPLVVEAPAAVNSPDTVWVRLDVADDQPYLRLTPEHIRVASVDPVAVTTFTTVTNAGIGSLGWSARCSSPWLDLDRLSGTDNEQITFSIDTAWLSPGIHQAVVIVTDSAAFNISESLIFDLDYLVVSEDTIVIGATEVGFDSPGRLPISVTLANQAGGIVLPLNLESSMVTIDSVRFGDAWPSFVYGSYQTDLEPGVVTLSLETAHADSVLMPGTYELAELFFTTGNQGGLWIVGEPPGGNVAAVVISPGGARFRPAVLPGEVIIDAATGVAEAPPTALPAFYALQQNYPNPFNPTTTIEFEVPQAGPVELEVFNILGQCVATLVDETLSVGQHTVVWEGLFPSGRSAPSGIYFYRLRAAERSLVRKMILVR